MRGALRADVLIGWVSHDAKIVVLPALAAGAEVRRACAQRLAAESTPSGVQKEAPPRGERWTGPMRCPQMRTTPNYDIRRYGSC